MKSKLTSLIILMSLLTSCAPTARLVNQGNIYKDIQMKTFIIKVDDVHAWNKWAMIKNARGEDSIALEKLKIWRPSGEIQAAQIL